MAADTSNPNICRSCSTNTYITLHYAQEASSLREVAHRVCLSCINQLSNNGQSQSIKCPSCLDNVTVSYIYPQVDSIDLLYQKLQNLDPKSVDAYPILGRLKSFIRTSCGSLMLKNEHVKVSLLFAVEKGDVELTSFFLNHRNLNLETRLEGIQMAMEKGHPEIVRELIGSKESTEFWGELIRLTKSNLEDLDPLNVLNIEIRIMGFEPKYKMVMALLQLGHRESCDCLSLLGRCFETGIGVEKNLIRASDLYTQGRNTNGECAYRSAEFRLEGLDGFLQNLDEAINLFKLGAEKFNNTNCMLRLGDYFLNRSELPEDKAAGAEWYRKGALLGNARCMFQFAECLKSGNGVPKKLEDAVRWYLKGAKAGDGLCMLRFGDFLKDGTFLPKDVQQAFRYYLKGADLGNGHCMYRLGSWYKNPTGIPPNLQLAIHWYEEGAKAGHGLCMVELARCYESGGLGIQQDDQSAFDWYTKSLNFLSSSQFREIKKDVYFILGNRCETGLGCPQNPELALDYYSKAEELGHPQAGAKFIELGSKLEIQSSKRD